MSEQGSSVLEVKKETCCGCGACEAICLRNAIHMRLDEDGFYYPTIDQQNCVKCGMCIKVCISNR